MVEKKKNKTPEYSEVTLPENGNTEEHSSCCVLNISHCSTKGGGKRNMLLEIGLSLVL